MASNLAPLPLLAVALLVMASSAAAVHKRALLQADTAAEATDMMPSPSPAPVDAGGCIKSFDYVRTPEPASCRNDCDCDGKRACIALRSTGLVQVTTFSCRGDARPEGYVVGESRPEDYVMQPAAPRVPNGTCNATSILAKVETSIAALEQAPQNTVSIALVLDKVQEAMNLLKEIQSQLVG